MSDSKVLGQSKEQNTAQSKILSLCKDGSELLNQDDINGALKTFKKAFILSCNIPEEKLQKACLFNLGAAYICVGKPKKALKCLVKSRINGMEERDGDLYFNIGAAYDEMKEYGKAVRFYERAINEYGYEELKSIADALIKLGYCFVMIGDLSSAAHSFRLAGHSYMKNEKPEDAAMAMREAAKYMIDSQAFSQAEVLQTLNSCVESLKTISDEHLLGTLYNHVGLHYAELKYFSQAEKCFTASLNLCNGKQFSIRKMAVLLQNLGAVDNALCQYEKSLRSHAEAADMYGSLGDRSPQGQCLSNLAFAYSQLKNYDLAEFYYQQAHQAFVDAGDILRQCLVSEGLGATYFCLGNLDQAISHYKQALTLSGKSKETSNVIRERILEKLTDTIEYKVTHDRPAISTEKASRTKPDLSPSNCVNDACKSVTSQYHESCLNIDVTTSESSDDEEGHNHSSPSKVQHFQSSEQDISESESISLYSPQRILLLSEFKDIPGEDEEQSDYSTDSVMSYKETYEENTDTLCDDKSPDQYYINYRRILPYQRLGLMKQEIRYLPQKL
ncbi:tetratricopeptide repeat protein 24-like isoform X1 [Engystomops pustulosus]|uniref:tetratricopeptide repeat protein 24-like isoform X1 n=1 Tax=Engystomops pustulosus TaxID=76066 RepID=UPI003AFAF485